MTRPAPFLLIATLFLAAAAQAAAAKQPVVHAGQTPRDAFVLAVQNLTGKPVLWHPWQPEFESLAVPHTRRQLDRVLAASKFRLIEDERWAYLIRREIVFPYAKATPAWMRIRARKFTLTPRTFVFHEDPSDEVPRADRERFRAVILRDARLVPTHNADPDPDANDGELPLELVFAKFRIDDTTTGVVTLVRPDADAEVGRVVFGTVTRGEYRVLWDSPLVPARAADVLLTDLDADGAIDIALRARTDEQPARDLLTAFDQHGRELTRQAQCEPFAPEDLGPLQGQTCPIAAEQILLDRHEGRVDITATTGLKTSRYVLYHGTFVPSRPASR